MIFDPQIARWPNKYPWTQDFIDAMWTGFWTPNEFTFTSDEHDFKTILTEEERGIVVNTLSAIGQIEVAVKRFWSKMGDVLPHPGIVDLGLVMAHVEVIHNKAYEKLLQKLGLIDIFEDNLKLPVISNRVNYLQKHLEKKFEGDKQQYIYSIILFTLFVENVSLFSQFYVIKWFNRFKNILKDTDQQVTYTFREEQLHSDIGTKIINTMRSEYPELFTKELEDLVLYQANEAFKAESGIIDWIINGYSQKGISAPLLKNYILGRINSSLNGIGFRQLADTDPNLNKESFWMEEEILATNVTDFFHRKPVDYQMHSQPITAEDLF